MDQQLAGAASILQQLPETVVLRRQNSSGSSAASSSSSSPLLAEDLALEGRALWRRERSRVLSGCEPGGENKNRKKLKVALLMSGGVDSSVALHLLTEAGHDVWPFYLKIWFEEDFRNSWSSCPWEEDVEAAQAVLDAVFADEQAAGAFSEDGGGSRREKEKTTTKTKRPLTLVPLTEHYWRRVVDAAVSDLRKGRTPNPDVLCNSRVKFGAFVEMLAAGEVEGFEKSNDGGEQGGGGLLGCGFDRVASGHYASLLRPDSDSSGSSSTFPPLLGVARDDAKDQTYFLARLSEQQLSAAMFPLGPLEKREVRALAAAAALPNAARADSQGLCFLGKVRFDEFVAAHLGKWPGPLVEEVEEEEEEEEEDVEAGEVEEETTTTTTTTTPTTTKKKTVLKRTVVGFHDGAWFFTPGQRKGIGLSGGPWFVTRKDMRTNAVFVSRSYKPHAHHSREEAERVEKEGRLLEERRRRFVVGSLAWLPGGSADSALDAAREGKLRVKVRHGPSSYRCGLEVVAAAGESAAESDAGCGDGGPSSLSSSSSSSSSSSPSSQSSSLRLRVSLDRPDQGLAPGQFAVFYDGERGVCVGSGVIEASGGGGGGGGGEEGGDE